MLTLRCVKKTRAFLSPIPIYTHNNQPTYLFLLYSTTTSTTRSSTKVHLFPSAKSILSQESEIVATHFREWFMSRQKPLLDRIHEILRQKEETVDGSLSALDLRLSERLVLDVLRHRKPLHRGVADEKVVLSCMKFFDWAGRQHGFYHTRATYHAIFKILSRANHKSAMFDIIGSLMKLKGVHNVGFFNTLVMGYAVAGKPQIALQLFGRMRFQGIDLDAFAYHVLLNGLVEENCFEVVDMIANQIRLRGFENQVTHSVLVKSLCKQKEFKKALMYIRGLVDTGIGLSDHCVAFVVQALCENKQFEMARKLLEEVRESELIPMGLVYGAWITNLVRFGKVQLALEFLHEKKSVEGYVPGMFRYNILICRLLRENRLPEVCDLLMEMKENEITPDDVTMNAALCFFCKAGMVEVALQLYNSKDKFGLSPSSMAYNYLVNRLCGNGSVDEAYRVSMDSIIRKRYPIGKKTFSIVTDALCRERKYDKMIEFVSEAVEHNFVPANSTYDKLIYALCRNKKVEHAYRIHGNLGRLVTSKFTYSNLIDGFNRENKGDISAALLMEMQEKGHAPIRKLFRSVIKCLCDTPNPEEKFLTLLDVQLKSHDPTSQIYNFFIDGAGHAGQPKLAKHVYEKMAKNGTVPCLSSDVLMLQSYLRNERISDALNFYHDLSKKRKIGRKLCNAMIVGLCKADRPEIVFEIFLQLRADGLKPSLECYEELVKLMCSHKQYDKVMYLIDDLMKVGRNVSSFIGNVLLLHALKTQMLYGAWVRSRDLSPHDNTPFSWVFGELIGAFSDYMNKKRDIEDLEKVIEQCFPLDIFTYNMLLRKLSVTEMDSACELFDRICQKGYEPNEWTYRTIVHGFYKQGMKAKAEEWVKEMYLKGFGFDLTEGTKLLT